MTLSRFIANAIHCAGWTLAVLFWLAMTGMACMLVYVIIADWQEYRWMLLIVGVAAALMLGWAVLWDWSQEKRRAS